MVKAKRKKLVRGKLDRDEYMNGVSDVPDVSGNPEEIMEALEDQKFRDLRIRAMEGVLERMTRLRNADDILYEFSADAARLLVFEMYTGRQAERIKAIQQVLDRSLGRPVERSVTLNVKEYGDAELDNQIKDLMHELGFIKDKERGSVSLLIEGERDKGEKEVIGASDASLAGEVSSEQKEDTPSGSG